MTETDEEINEKIHEIMGLCKHEGDGSHTYNIRCSKCDKVFNPFSSLNYTFTGNWQTSAYEFGLLWEFMQKHERWEEFLEHTIGTQIKYTTNIIYNVINIDFISPRTLAEAVVRFLRRNK